MNGISTACARTNNTALTFLEQHKLGVLSTVSDKGEVWGAAIYYAVDEQLNFYFFTHIETRKYHNLKEHPQVALTVVDDYAQATVQATGQVTELPMGEEMNEAYRKLALVHPPGQFSWVPPVSKIHDQGATTVLKLTPETLQLSHFKPETNRPGGYVTRVV